jgi:hypothetical protein
MEYNYNMKSKISQKNAPKVRAIPQGQNERNPLWGMKKNHNGNINISLIKRKINPLGARYILPRAMNKRPL